MTMFQIMGKTYSGKTYSAKRKRIRRRLDKHLSLINERHAVDNQEHFTHHQNCSNDCETIETSVVDESSTDATDGVDNDVCNSRSEAFPSMDGHCSTALDRNDSTEWTCQEQQSSMNLTEDHNHVSNHISDTDDGSETDGQYAKQLREWALQHNMSHMAVTDLLHILVKVPVPGIPTSARTLLKTERNTDVKKKAGGDYYYFGVRETLQAIADQMKVAGDGCGTLSLQLNIDGLPLFKSSRTSLWPILFTVEEWQREVFMAALFGGTEKPSSLYEFLGDFVDEMKMLEASGIQSSNETFKVTLKSVVCDAPARAFLKAVKGHSGYHCCERCDQPGVYFQNRMTLPDMGANARDDALFEELQDEDHHIGESPLSELNIGMVSSFPLDYMHLVCLGVMRKLLALWLEGPLSCRLPGRLVRKISDLLKGLRETVPEDFARRPRSLDEFRMWKAVEFRQLLLYTGPVVFKGTLPKNQYQHFLLLSVAMRLLLSKRPVAEEINYAEKLLRMFVAEFSALYGKENLVYNVHSLIHIADDARKYGCLDSISAFIFENYLKDVKQMVRKQHQVVPQIVRRVLEAQQSRTYKVKECSLNCEGEHYGGPVPDDYQEPCKQFAKVKSELLLSTKAQDSYVESDGQVFRIRNIIRDRCGEIKLVTEEFDILGDEYHFPLSSSSLGVVCVRQGSEKMSVISMNSVCHKLWMMTNVRGCSVVVPVLHSP